MVGLGGHQTTSLKAKFLYFLLDLTPILFVTLAIGMPLWLAIDLLSETATHGLPEGWFRLDQRRQTNGALTFSFFEALLSTVATLFLGLPLAWALGRYRWPFHRLLRSIFTMPFVVPSIVAAIGFLSLFGPQGPLVEYFGIDLIREEGFISRFINATGWEHSGWWISIILAHAWYNISLVVRFVEPVIARMDPIIEESARLLPRGKGIVSRIRHLWLPLLTPSIAAAAIMTFIFSFSSFAIIRWLGGDELYTLERGMAELGGPAGIPGYGATASEVVLALGTIQLVVMLLSLGILSRIQQARQNRLPQAGEKQTRKRLSNPLVKLRQGDIWRGSAALFLPSAVVVMLLFILSPLWFVVAGSFKVRGEWTLEAWKIALGGGHSTGGSTMFMPIYNSLTYATVTLLIALPLALITTQTIVRAEKKTNRFSRFRAWFTDVAMMSPLALSAVMVGLGVLIGILRVFPELFGVWWLPLWGHLVLATPFALRVLLPAHRALDPHFDEVAKTLRIGKVRRWLQVQLPLLRGSIIVASSLVVAISLGEFGATWVVVSSDNWMTLPVFIDTQLARPFDPFARPTGHVGATVLLVATLLVFMLVERFRVPGQESEF